MTLTIESLRREYERVRKAAWRARKKNAAAEAADEEKIFEEVAQETVADKSATSEPVPDAATDAGIAAAPAVTDAVPGDTVPKEEKKSEKRKEAKEKSTEKKEKKTTTTSSPAAAANCLPFVPDAEPAPTGGFIRKENLSAPCQHVLDAWNQLPLKKMQGLYPGLLQKLLALLARYSETALLSAIEKIKNSQFLLGKARGGKGWTIRFPWLLDAAHLENILDDKYADFPRLAANAASAGADAATAGSWGSDACPYYESGDDGAYRPPASRPVAPGQTASGMTPIGAALGSLCSVTPPSSGSFFYGRSM